MTVLNVARDKDDQVLRAVRKVQVVDEAPAMVRRAVNRPAVEKRFAAKAIRFIGVLKNRHAVSQVGVRNDAATPVLENPARATPVPDAPNRRLAVAAAKVPYPTAGVVRQLELRRLRPVLR